MSSDLKDLGKDPDFSVKPAFDENAGEIMDILSAMTVEEIAVRLGISGQLAIKARQLAYDFPHKITGIEALYGFTGEAFKGLDASTLTPDALENAGKNLKFISSVYGLLNAGDIIKPYRYEFNKAVAPGNITAIQYYKPKVTSHLVSQIKKDNVTEIINLLPGDADKCIDWKIVKAFAKVYKIYFQEIGEDGRLKTPIAKRLKELRGLMARKILMENINSFKELTQHPSEHFIYSPEHSKPGMPVFLS